MIHFKSLVSSQAEPYLEDLGFLRITVFREFPYLYAGSMQYEVNYLGRYFKSKRSFVVLCLDDDKIVGAATGIPLEEETSQLQDAFRNHGFDPTGVFYFGESILLPPYRGQGIGKSFFSHRISHALTYPQMEHASFCAVIRSPDHPLRPKNYAPHDIFWTKQGFAKVPGLITHFSWPDIDKKADDEKAMQFWAKRLRP